MVRWEGAKHLSVCTTSCLSPTTAGALKKYPGGALGFWDLPSHLRDFRPLRITLPCPSHRVAGRKLGPWLVGALPRDEGDRWENSVVARIGNVL